MTSRGAERGGAEGGGCRPAFSTGHARFTRDAAVHAFQVQGEVIALRHHLEVFPPSSFGLNFAERIDYRECRRAADIGTGTGLLAILAAKKGVWEVKATDLSELAVTLADRDAREVNEVEGVETRQGHFFATWSACST